MTPSAAGPGSRRRRALRKGRRPPLATSVSTGKEAAAIEIVLAEFRELESEKRQFAQALLAVTGIVVGADTILIAQATLEHPLALVGLGPLSLAAFALVLTLRRYLSKFITHLADMEDQLNELGGGELLAWERSWYDRGPDSRLFGRLGFIVAMVLGAGLATIGLWVALTSTLVAGAPSTTTLSGGVVPAVAGWPDWLRVLAVGVYVGFCLFPSYVAVRAIEDHDREVRRWKACRRLRRATTARLQAASTGGSRKRPALGSERRRNRRMTD